MKLIDWDTREGRQKFYDSSEWKKTRAYKLKKNPLCELHLLKGKYVIATIIHHLMEIRYAPELALDMDNLQSVCESCHSMETLNPDLKMNPVNRKWEIEVIKLKKL